MADNIPPDVWSSLFEQLKLKELTDAKRQEVYANPLAQFFYGNDYLVPQLPNPTKGVYDGIFPPSPVPPQPSQSQNPLDPSSALGSFFARPWETIMPGPKAAPATPDLTKGFKGQYTPPAQTGEGLNVYSRPTVPIDPNTGMPTKSSGTTYFPPGGDYGYNSTTGAYEVKRPGQSYTSVPAPKPNHALDAIQALSVDAPTSMPVLDPPVPGRPDTGVGGLTVGNVPLPRHRPAQPDKGLFGGVMDVLGNAGNYVGDLGTKVADLGGQAVNAVGSAGTQVGQQIVQATQNPLLKLAMMFAPNTAASGARLAPDGSFMPNRTMSGGPLYPAAAQPMADLYRYGATPEARIASADNRDARMSGYSSPAAQSQAQSGVSSSGTMSTDWGREVNYHDPNKEHWNGGMWVNN